MFKALLMADKTEQVGRLRSELSRTGLLCSMDCVGGKVIGNSGGRTPDLVLVTLNGVPDASEMAHIVRGIRQESHLPVIALLSREALHRLDPGLAVDDFVVEPWDVDEVVARMQRILGKGQNTINQDIVQCGALTIDPAKYEVYVDGHQVELTFREYQLLKFLAGNRGRVFTREALLNKVWGYDYFGGDRTVDVHIRRLRSKIEDSTHTFIETVRSIGYRFKKEI